MTMATWSADLREQSWASQCSPSESRCKWSIRADPGAGEREKKAGLCSPVSKGWGTSGADGEKEQRWDGRRRAEKEQEPEQAWK